MVPVYKLSLTGANAPIIGQGSFGKVYSYGNKVYKKFKLLVDTKNNQDFAIIENNIKEVSLYKLLLNKSTNSFTSSIVLSELSPYLSTSEKITYIAPHVYILMDNYGISLSKLQYTTLSSFKSIFKQIAHTIKCLNISNMSHGDLKPNNILINQTTNKVTIIDYGSVCFFHSRHITNEFQRCTIFYVSPEELLKGNYSLYNDWWSLGVIIFEFYTKKCFIKKLLEHLNVKKDIVNMFMEYSCELKSTASFNPTHFLMSVYSKIKNEYINQLIMDNVHERDVQLILMYLLIINPKQRNTDMVMSLLECEEVCYKEEVNIQSSLEEFKTTSLLSFNTRKFIVESIFSLCINSKKFGRETIGHSIMLFDRFCSRARTPFNPYIYSVISSVFSCILLKAEIFKGSFIISTIKEVYPNINISIDELKDHIINFLSVMDFSLMCLTPDMLYSFEVDYSYLLSLYTRYALVNKQAYEIYKLVK